jgi:pyrroline-5-carboxylate reductase
MILPSKIGFWGSSNMASAMMHGLISRQVVKPSIAGRGPAYVFEFISPLAEAGEKEGLSSEMGQ